jgi:hypothetical protein
MARRINSSTLHTWNVAIGNYAFADKKDHLSKSAYILTSEVGKKPTWGIAEIKERQKKLAAIAVQTWPIEVR